MKLQAADKGKLNPISTYIILVVKEQEKENVPNRYYILSLLKCFLQQTSIWQMPMS
jgi:hypothetical protein